MIPFMVPFFLVGLIIILNQFFYFFQKAVNLTVKCIIVCRIIQFLFQVLEQFDDVIHSFLSVSVFIEEITASFIFFRSHLL